MLTPTALILRGRREPAVSKDGQMQGACLGPWFETPRLRAALTMRFRIGITGFGAGGDQELGSTEEFTLCYPVA